MINKISKQSHLALFFAMLSLVILTNVMAAYAAPGILDGGMTPEKKMWSFSGERDYSADSRYKFWLRVSRAGNLNRYGTFDYNFNVRVIRPDGKEVWNTNYGFDEKGYSEIEFSLPALFYERSDDRFAPVSGVWKIHVGLTHKDTGKDADARDYMLTFGKGKEVSGQGGAVVYLSDMKEIRSGDVHGGLGKDRPYWQPDLIIGGRTFKKGLVTHPVAENGRRAFVEYELNGRYRFFMTTLGAAQDHGNYGRGTMSYYILADGREVAGGRFPVPPDTRNLRISVSGVRILRLEVDNGGDGNNSDHAAWGDARVEK